MRKVAWSLMFVLGMSGVSRADAVAPAADEGQIKEGQPAPVFRGKVLNHDVVGERAMALDTAAAKNKATILSFFATYCEPCKKELPYLQQLFAKYKDQGLGVMVVSIDTKQEDIQVAEDLAKQHGLTYPVMSDRFNIVAKRYGVKRLPCLYMIDGGGKVSMVNTGYSEEFSGTLLAAVQQRLGVPADPNAVPHAAPAAQPAPAAVATPPAEDPKAAAEDSKKGKKKKGK